MQAKLKTGNRFHTPAILLAAVLVGLLTVSNSLLAQESASESGLPAENSTPEDGDDPYGLRTVPPEGQDIGIDPREGRMLDMQVPFVNDQNEPVLLADLFDGKRPVMLSFNYSDCPKLCSVQLKNMVNTLREVDFKIEQDFQLVSISIDPNESVSRARNTKEKFMGLYNHPEFATGWHFLTGEEDSIRSIADQCGFRYKYVPQQKLYSHPPVFILVSPQGKIVRYIHGLDYDPDTIRLALIESAEGKIGSPINILSYGIGCFTFDPSKGKYTFQAMAIMRLCGMLTVVGLVIGLVPYWFFRRERPDQPYDVAERESLTDSTI